MAKEVRETKNPLLTIGFLLMLVSVGVLFAYYFLKVEKRGENLQRVPDKEGEENVSVRTANWLSYENSEFKFSLRHPLYLYKREFKDVGGYLYLIRFEETKFSKEKGIVVGVSEGEFAEVLGSIKNSLIEEGGKEVDTKEINFEGKRGNVTFFDPEGADGEKRAVAVIENENLVYSISTTPEQIDLVLSTFTFLNSESDNIFCGGIAGVSCPDGFSCKYNGDYPDAGGVCIKNE